MATIEEKLKNVRTMEDVVNMLTILFTNLNNQNEMYYNMFLNPTPMDIDLERYDENGELVTVTLPNRAKDRIWVYTGTGNPNGVLAARVGSVYLDTANRIMYFKSAGEDSSGWIKLWAENNLNYLAPDGDGSQLTHLNAGQIETGILQVERGGTGTPAISGIIQGNGTSPFTAADIGSIVASMGELVGMIMWCPYTFEDESELGRWFVCNGRAISRVDYEDLFSKIGIKYGAGDGVSTFNIPNLIGKYIKGGNISDVGAIENGHIPAHNHNIVEGTRTGPGSAHSHGGNTLDVPSYARFAIRRSGGASGAFSFSNWKAYRGDADGDGNQSSRQLNFSTSGKWSGETTSESSHTHSLSGMTTTTAGSGNTNEVDHMILVPVIRY